MLRTAPFFHLFARPYQALTAHPIWEEHCAAMAAHLPPGAATVVDVGCGPGNSAAQLLHASLARVIALDPARGMLRRARLRDRRLELVCAEAERLPLRAGAVDAVSFRSVLYLLEDKQAALREALRVLRPGGRVLLLEPQAGLGHVLKGLGRALRAPRWALCAAAWRSVSGVYGGFSRASLRGELSRAGFRVLRLEPALDGLGLAAVAERPAR